MTHAWWHRCLEALLPPRCLLCDAPAAGGWECCTACLAALPHWPRACVRCAGPLAAATEAALCGACLRRPPPLDLAVAAFAYRWPLDVLVPRLKFHQDLAAGRLLSALMRERLASLPRPRALVPVPLHRERLRTRGYDQAQELAQPLARAFGLPCLALLERRRPTRAQSELDAAARVRNLRGAFVARAAPAYPDHVALVDDVMTTGATLHAAATALRRAGVVRVDAWVCARVP